MDSGSCDELWLEVESKQEKHNSPENSLLKAEEESPSAMIMGWQVEDGLTGKLSGPEAEKLPIFTLNSTNITQGGLFEIRCFTSREEAPGISGTITGIQPFFPSAPGCYTALIPTDYLSVPGTYELSYGYEDVERTATLVIEPRKFYTQDLEISEEIIEETKTEDASLEFNQHYYAAITDDSYQPGVGSISEMDFMWPTSGIITTTYGEERYYNGVPAGVYHRGVDIAGDLGDEVYAAADGSIGLAKNLISSGNTVIIGHGLGIYTAYFHLDGLVVKQGDIVRKGDLIGYQGTTGFSNGVHLHFELSVRDTTLEPGYYILGREVDY